MMKQRTLIGLLFLTFPLSCGSERINQFNNNGNGADKNPSAVETLTSWSEGYLDIHHINTGKGECSFFIFPDGTTMLVDAGITTSSAKGATAAKPNNSKTPGEWIARYILHFIQGFPVKKLDYMVASHFHEDHLGGITPGIKTAKAGTYKLTGLTEVGELISFDKIIDRGWPDYDWPVIQESAAAKNYIQFVKWQTGNKHIVAEQFIPGRNTQLVIKNNPGKYPNFEIRNIAANGWVWTGVGSETKNHFPDLKTLKSADYPSENNTSIAFRMSYGKFDYFSGGDISFRGSEFDRPEDQWKNIEIPVGEVTGAVEACKANHHGNYDANCATFLRALSPQVIVIPTWLAQQLDMAVLRRMLSPQTYPGSRDIFVTNVKEETKVVLGYTADKLKSQQGHVVIRVSPGGSKFMVYVLKDSNENFWIKSTFGPYSCK
jgi:beta-lactamase superfamily II metal-dependent hydrolase